MSEQETVALFVLVGVIFTAVLSVLAVVLANRQKSLELIIENLRAEHSSTRDELAATRAELAATRAEVSANERDIAALKRRDHALVRYVRRLRKHIHDELPPPPPPWPPELERDLDTSDDDEV